MNTKQEQGRAMLVDALTLMTLAQVAATRAGFPGQEAQVLAMAIITSEQIGIRVEDVVDKMAEDEDSRKHLIGCLRVQIEEFDRLGPGAIAVYGDDITLPA